MRTTLDIEEDVLIAAKEIAAREKSTAGKILSNLARQALNRPVEGKLQPEIRNGLRLLPRGNRVITNEHVNKLRDELGI